MALYQHVLHQLLLPAGAVMVQVADGHWSPPSVVEGIKKSAASVASAAKTGAAAAAGAAKGAAGGAANAS